jgi:hypothetical protein
MSLQPVPSVFRVPKATANPRLSGVCERAEVTVLLPDRYPGPQPPPNGQVSLPFQPELPAVPPGDHGLEIGFAGSSRIAIR